MVRPVEGALWGDDSLAWKFNSRWFTLIGGARAAIMQTCDPKVAAGVSDHSTYRTDPFGRLERTMDAMLAISFGSPERREQVLTGLREMHSKVRGRTAEGEAYSALDPRLMFWVLATLTDTVLVVERRYVGRMTEYERERYYVEGLPMTDAFGIPAQYVPQTLSEFREYMTDTVAAMRPNEASREIARSLLQPGIKWVPDMAFAPLDRITVELLPTPLRRRLLIDDLSSVELAAVRSAQAVSRRALPRVPAALSVNPFAAKAVDRAVVGVA